MNSIHLSSLRRKVSGRGLKWSSFFILSAVLITSGFFIYNALAEDIFAVTSPSGGEYWRATQTVTWTSPSVNPAYNFYVYAWKDNNIITSYSVDISGLSYTARSTSWNTVGVPDGSYNIRVLLYDPNTSTEVGQVFSSAFTVDNTAPTMNSAQTKTVTSIDVTFSEDLNGATVATGDFSVAGNTVSTATESAPGIITLILGTPIATDAVPAVTLVNGQSVADLAGNTVTGDGTGTYNKTPTDGIAPTIVSVNSDKADGSYKAGEVIDIDVTFSENVTSAEVAVTLETGNTDRSCTFAPTNANTGTCNYTVQVLDTSADLNVNTIAGTINDQSANTMSDFSIATNLAANKALVIDTTPPTVTVIMDDDALNVGDTSLVTFTFSEAPTNFTVEDATVINNGALTGFAVDDGDAKIYTATFTPTDNIEVTTNVITVGTSWTDAAGNAPLAGDDSPNYTIDTKEPTITVTMSVATFKVGETATVTFTFSEAPTNFTTTDVTFGNGAIGTIDTSNALVQTAIFTPTDDIEVATNIISVGTAWTDAAGNAPLAGDDSPNYTIDTKEPTVIGITPTALAEANVGSVTVDITFSENMNQADNTTVNVAGITGSPIVVAYGSWTSATIWRGTFILVDNNEEVTNAYYTVSGAEDVAGNTMVAIVARGVNNPLDVDTIKPTVEVTMGAATFKVGETTTVTFTFSEAPTNFTVEDATVINNGALTGFAVDDGDAKIYTATFTPTDNIEVTTNVITVGMSWTDAAGNAPLAGDDSPNYTIDTKEPTVIVTMDDAALNVGDDSLVTFTFSEAPTGFATNDVTVGNGTIGAINTTNPLIQTATYTPTDDLEAGTNVITVGTTWTDAAGNVPQAVSDSPNYTIDTKEPIVIIASVTADPTNGLIAVTVQFSETVTGFDGTDITIGNGVVESFVAVDGDSYTFNVNPTDGTSVAVTIDVLVNKAIDAAGNNNLASNQLTYTSDTVAPTVAAVFTDTALIAGETSVVTFTFSEAVTGFNETDVAVANGTMGTVAVTGNPLIYTGTFTPAINTENNTNIATVGINWTDTAGNAPVGTTDSANYTIETLRPTVGIVFTDTALKVGETSLVTFTFSEVITGFTNGDLTIANGTLTGVSSADGGITWIATFTPTDDLESTTNVITINNTGVADTAGNAGVGTTDSPNYAIDTKEPTVTVVLSDTTLKVGETTTVTFTFHEAVTGFDNADITTIENGELTNVSSADENITFTATFTPTDNIEVATNVITVTMTGVTDTAGNAGVGTTSSDNYTIDTKEPTVEVTMGAATFKVGETATVTFTFSEAPTGFTVEDATVINNGDLSAFIVTGDTKVYTATFTPTDNIEVATNIITVGTDWTDAAGNAPLAGDNSPNYTIDTKEPTVVLASDTTNPTNGLIAVTVQFSETVTGFDGTDITIGNGVVESFVAVDGDSYTFNVNPTDGTSVAVTIDVLVNKAIDAAGNNNLASNQLTYTSDTVVPTLTTVIIASNNANTALAKAGDTVTLSFTSSETIQVNPVVAITSGSVAITNAITIANPSGNNWTATNIVNTSDTNGVVAFTINFIDTSGNTGTQVTAVTNGSSVTIDRTAPTLAEVTPVPTPTKDTTPDYTFSSNETGTITYAGGCTSGTTAASSGNNPITYTTLTDGIYGGCTIIVTDATGNASSALDVTDFTVDTVVPVISSLVPSSGATTFDATPTIGANYTDASAGINTSTVVITVDGTNVTAFATINVGDVSYTPASAMTDGIHTVTVNVNDLAGNSAVQASWSFRIASSGVAVTTDVTTVVADNLTQAKITVQVLDVNSDPVTSGNVDFISNIGTITPVTVALNGDGEAVAYIKSSDVGLSTITASFNAESGTTQVTFTLYDGTNPVVSSLAVDTDPAGTGDVLNITFNVNETLISNPAVTVDGNNATFSSVIGLSYRYTYTVTGSETEGNVVVLVSAEDTSSNVGTGSISNLTLDFSVPTFTIIEGTDTGPVQTDTINVTITEDNAITVSKYGFSTDAVCNASDTYGNAFTSGVSFDITGDHADYLCVMATNDSGNTGYQLVGQLNVDNTAPTITTQYPADNSTDVVISVNPYIDFSEAIDGTTLISGNVELRNATSSAVIASTYNISTNGDGTTRLTFIPNSALAYSTQYYFFVDADVEDTASNTFAGNTWEAAQKSSHEFTTIAEDVPVTTYNIALTSGWNLISLPLIPNSTVIGNVLAGISGNVIMVRYYDASSVSWLSYVPGVGGSLTTMEDGKGYWINMNASNTLTVNGVEMPGPEEELPNYSVVEGWNLIGFKSVETKKSSEYLSGLSYIVLYGYNGAYSTIAHPTDIDNNMTPGSGFWAYFSTAGTIIP